MVGKEYWLIPPYRHDALVWSLPWPYPPLGYKLPINLPFLSEFFSESELDFLNSDSLLNTSLSVHLPTLAIASEKYKHELEIRDETAFEMQSIINKTKQDTKAFRSLLHFLYNTLLTVDDLNEDFDVFNFLDWLILIASLAAGVAIIWFIILHLIRFRSESPRGREPAGPPVRGAASLFIYTGARSRQ